MQISIHTTAKVVTYYSSLTTVSAPYFNPHHHEGGDNLITYIIWLIVISIHTTAKVVTCIQRIRFSLMHISIHTTAKVVTVEAEGFVYV